jgi:hypothetical protein
MKLQAKAVPIQKLSKRVLFRFLRGFVAGAVSTAATISVTNASSWGELASVLNNLTISLIAGGVGGGLMALDKFFRDKRAGRT